MKGHSRYIRVRIGGPVNGTRLMVYLVGMASPLVGIAAVNSLLFAAYNVSKRVVTPFPDITLPQVALAGSMAGAVNSLLASPGTSCDITVRIYFHLETESDIPALFPLVELFKVKMQGQYGLPGDRRLRAVVGDTWKTWGFRKGIMRGFWATVAREIPAYGA